MGAFNQLNGAIFDAGAIEARLSAIDGKSIYNQRDGATLDMDSLARRLTALDGKVAVGQGGIEFDVDSFMRRLAAIEAAGSGFNPASLFASGEQGAWYDPSDFSTMWQDSAGTTPVTAAGQPVGKILDKSGRLNHATQATTTSRPLVQQDAGGFYLAPDGVDDTMASPAFTLPATSTMAAAVLLPSNQLGNVFDGVTLRQILGLNSNVYRMYQGTEIDSVLTRDSAAHVLLANFLGTASSSLELDKSTIVTGNAGAGTLTGGLQLFAAGGGASQFMSGRFYGGVVISRTLTASEKASLYTYLGAKAGVAL